MFKRAKWFVPLALSLVVMLAGAALAATAWLSPTVEHPRVGLNYTWNYGSSLGATTDGSLHAAYVTDFINGVWATDAGPYQGTYYTHGTVGAGDAVTWSSPRRVSPLALKHTDRSTLEAEGNHVYVTFSTMKSYDAYSSADPRVLYVRTNTSNGAAASWLPVHRLSPLTGRVDYPVPAAGGTNAYVLWTNSDTGKMTLARSIDQGANWLANVSLGTTTKLDTDDSTEGYGGWPGICADGNVVGAAWFKNPAGNIVARVSLDGGATWGGAVTIEAGNGAADNSYPQCTARDGGAGNQHVFFTWTNHLLVKSAMFDNSRTVFTPGTVYTYASGIYDGGYGPAPVFSPDGTDIGVAFTGCKKTLAVAHCDYYDSKARVDTLWTESDNGGAWTPAQLLATNSSTRVKAYLNDFPSPVWYDADTRFVTYNTYNPSYSRYKIELQTGEGAA